MNELLKDIANIQTGVFAKTVSNGDIVYLNAKHFDETESSSALHPDLNSNDISRNIYFNMAMFFSLLKAQKILRLYMKTKISLQLLLLHFLLFVFMNPSSIKYLPDFLAWFINNLLVRNI